MIRKRLHLFNGPDTGAGGGAGASGGAGTGSAGAGVVPAQTSGGAGGSESQGGGEGGGDDTIKTPWDSIDLETLDEQTRGVIEAGKKAHIEQVRANQTLQRNLNGAIETSRRFQSEFDRLQAQQPRRTEPEPEPFEVETANYLRTKGYTPEQVKAQAPLLGGLFKHLMGTVKNEIGVELAPLANTVIGHQNTSAFSAAQQSEAGTELLGIPEVAQQVWEAVTTRTQQGASMNPEAILNLAKMFYFDHTRANPGARPMLPTPPTPRPANSTALTFPGSGAYLRPNLPGSGNPNGGSAINADTAAALESTFAALEATTGIAPAAYKGAAKRAGGRR